MLPPFHGERMRGYEAVIREVDRARRSQGWPREREFALHPQHAGDHARGDPAGRLRGRGRRAPRGRSRESLVEILARPPRRRRSGSPPRASGSLPPFRRDRSARGARADELLVRGDRRAPPAPGPRRARRHPLDAAHRPLRGRLADGRPRAPRPADDPAARRATRPPPPGSPGPSTCSCTRPEDARAAPRRSSPPASGAYLDAVIDETLRVRPVVPFTGRLLREDSELGGYDAPRRDGDPGRDLPRPHPRRHLSRTRSRSGPSASSATRRRRPTRGSRSAAAPAAASAPPSPSSRCGSRSRRSSRSVELRAGLAASPRSRSAATSPSRPAQRDPGRSPLSR